MRAGPAVTATGGEFGPFIRVAAGDWALARRVSERTQLWIVPLDEFAQCRALTRVLSREEWHRRARFASPQLQDRYASGRVALRMLLGSALDMHPADVPLTTARHGKPQLLIPTPIRFNASRCGGTAAIALTTHGEIGVDVEGLANVTEPRRLATLFFDEGEAQVISGLPADLAAAGFLRCWTAKEAVLKALGVGLTQPLSGVVVQADPRAPIRLLRAPGSQPVSDFTLQELGVPALQLRIVLAVAAPHVPRAAAYRLETGSVGRET